MGSTKRRDADGRKMNETENLQQKTPSDREGRESRYSEAATDEPEKEFS